MHPNGEEEEEEEEEKRVICLTKWGREVGEAGGGGGIGGATHSMQEHQQSKHGRKEGREGKGGEERRGNRFPWKTLTCKARSDSSRTKGGGFSIHGSRYRRCENTRTVKPRRSNQQRTLNKLPTELRSRNFVNKHRLSIQSRCQTYENVYAMCMYSN